MEANRTTKPNKNRSNKNIRNENKEGGDQIEGELVFMAIIMLIGQIILMMMWQNNWFKKENFKIQKSNLLAQNRLQLRKLERDMGLSKAKEIIPAEKPGILGGIADLLPLLKGLNADQIGALADKFLGGSDNLPVEAGGGGGVTDMLMDFATKNPEMVQDILGGISSGYKEGGGTGGGSTDGFIAQG